MASALREIAAAPDPSLRSWTATCVRTGFASNACACRSGDRFVYENRPNVTSDVAGLCIRSGNAAYLRGSSSAMRTNKMIVGLWNEALAKEVCRARGRARRGSEPRSGGRVHADDRRARLSDTARGPSLIKAMREHARVPYVLDGDGNCHVYVDEFADLNEALALS